MVTEEVADSRSAAAGDATPNGLLGRAIVSRSPRSGGNRVQQLAGAADLRLHRRELLARQLNPFLRLGEFRIAQFRLGLLR